MIMYSNKSSEIMQCILYADFLERVVFGDPNNFIDNLLKKESVTKATNDEPIPILITENW